MNLRHITRFTYTYTNFQGWRVAINRQGTTLARYFSDKQYGSEAAAREEAIRFRDMLLDEINRNPLHTREILDKYRVQPQCPYPAGLKPGKSEAEECSEKVSACSIRSNQVMQKVLRSMCSRLHLDTASVMKLSLYMFALQYNEQTVRAEQLMTQPAGYADTAAETRYLPAPSETLQRLITELEAHARMTGMPTFEEFSTGKARYAGPPDELDQHNTSPPPDAMAIPITNEQTYFLPPADADLSPSFSSPSRLAASQPLTPSSNQKTLFPSPALSALFLSSPI